MSLDKAIEHGKEYRKQYTLPKSIDGSCRNHGGKTKKHSAGQCQWCLENRMYQTTKEKERLKASENESLKGE